VTDQHLHAAACLKLSCRGPAHPTGWEKGAIALLAMLVTVGTARAAAGDTQAVSVGKTGNSGGAHVSGPPAVSANGRYVLYRNQKLGVTVRDRWAGTSEVINVTFTGGRPDVSAYNEALSANGRYATFCTAATDILPGDSNGVSDVFLRDRQTGVTERISVTSTGAEANGDSYASVISDDGRFVVFGSQATNLAPANTDAPAIFIRDRQLGTTRRLVNTPPWPLQLNGVCGSTGLLSMSANGRDVAFQATGPGPLAEDNVFVYDRWTSSTQRVSVVASGDALAPSGGAQWPSISANGRFVAFYSSGNDFGPADGDADTDVYVRDLQAGVTMHESYGVGPWVRGQAFYPSLSADGRFVSFASNSFNLVPGERDRNGYADIYTRDRLTGKIERNSFAFDGTDANGYSILPAITRNGRWVVFLSLASDLVTNDHNFVRDVFIYDRGVSAP
jgi:TolB protein